MSDCISQCDECSTKVEKLTAERDALRERVQLATEALSAIEKGMRRLRPNDHSVCAVAYRVAAKTLKALSIPEGER